jgi:hypothetical protein
MIHARLRNRQRTFTLRYASTSAIFFTRSQVGKNALDEREQSSRPAQERKSFIGRIATTLSKRPRIDEDVLLAILNLFGRVVARRIKPSPLFALAVCESMIATAGLASRPSCSRTAT